MEVILKQDVANLGYTHDIIKVKDGYGRNYLIPNKIAVIANDSNLRARNEIIKQQEHKAEKLLSEAQSLAEKLSAITLSLTVKANDKGKVFGRITTTQIADELAKQGLNIDKKIIVLEDIHQIGEYVASIKLHREVKGELKINVLAEATEEK